MQPFAEWPHDIRNSFEDFADEMAADGFAFLYQRILTDSVGPVLTAVVDGAVAGAIGPMEIRPDAITDSQLMPQYFGVHLATLTLAA